MFSVLIVGHRENGKYGHIPERQKKSPQIKEAMRSVKFRANKWILLCQLLGGHQL